MELVDRAYPKVGETLKLLPPDQLSLRVLQESNE
jgi:hypothetical protein